jgi:PAS domain S-box-containing protein
VRGYTYSEDVNDELDALRQEIARLQKDGDELRERARRAEDDLRASRALHAATIESLPFDFWARDREGYCFSQNSTTRNNWGDLLHKRPEDMGLPTEVVETWLANNRRALAGEIVHGDVTYSNAGEARDVHNVLAPIHMDDSIVGTLGVNIDITEHKRAEAALSRTLDALRASEEKLRMATDAAGIGLWSWDTRNDLVTWEAPLCAIFGLPPGKAPIGREGYLALVHPGDRQHATARIANGVGAGGWEDEFRIVRPDGTVRWVMAKGTVLHADGRDVVYGAVLDVTDRRHRDEQLRQAQKLEAVGQLTAGIAHNFNNMLMGILPNVQLAAQRSPPDVAALLKNAEHSAARAADLVRQLMTYAGRNQPSARSVTHIGPLVERAVEFCRTTFDQRIAISGHYQAQARARIDATQIEQALLNILINARDALAEARGEAPFIDVSVEVVPAGELELEERAGEFVRIRIRDNGVGMTPATAARIYEPFFTTKDVGKGTGLGLATTHAILREHGGFIACDTVPGEGTSFSLYLAFEPLQATHGMAPSESPPSGGTETILIVDDEPSIRRVVQLMLTSGGFNVKVAASGQEAIDLLADSKLASEVAVVLLDVSMPGMTSRVLRSRLRELASHAKVVYFTGYAFEATDPEDTVLEKPVSEKRLLGKIREVLDRREGES